MAKRYTWQQLEARAAKAKARETYLEAQKKNPVAKPYKAEGDKTTVAAYSFEDENSVVFIPIFTSTYTKITPLLGDIGVITEAVANALPLSTARRSFKEAHKQVLKITVHDAKVTPTTKNTPWGTRVVDMIDNSYSFPFSLGIDGTPTLKEAKAKFATVFSVGGTGRTLLNKKGSSAVLSFKGKTLSTIKA